MALIIPSAARRSRLHGVVTIRAVVVAAAAFSQGAKYVEGQEPIVHYVSLAGNGEQDCGVRFGEHPCRVRHTDPVEVIESHLDAGESVWRTGDVLNFAFKLPIRSADSSPPTLTGGVQAPLSQIEGTQYWVLSMFIPQINRASLTYTVVNPTSAGRSFGLLEPKRWRGPDAPAEAERSKLLHGKVRAFKVPSPALDEPREVFVYTPPGPNGPVAATVYMTDGGNVPEYASVIDTMIADGRLPRIMLVGSESGDYRVGMRGIRDVRAAEYVMGMDSTPARFLAHEAFFTNTLISWAELTLGAPRDRSRRILQGASAGAAFALQMGRRHPSLFAHVIADSPAGPRPDDSLARIVGAPTFYIWAGVLEEFMHQNGLDWKKALTAAGANAIFHDEVAGHDIAAWSADFPTAIKWSLGR